MSVRSTVLIVLGILLGIPLIVYFAMWWGTAAYYRGKTYAQHRAKNEYDNNIEDND